MRIAAALALGIAADRDLTKQMLERVLGAIGCEAAIFAADWREPPASRTFGPLRSLPDRTIAAPLVRDQREEWALWNDLMINPFLELEAERDYGRRLLEDEPNFVAQKRERDRRKAMFQRLADPHVFEPHADPIPGDEAAFAQALAETGIGPALAAVREPFLRPDFQQLVADYPKTTGTANRLIARALVAAALRVLRDQGIDPDVRIKPRTRRALADGVLRRLGGDPIGSGEMFRLAEAPITKAAFGLRPDWTRAHWEWFGELMVYRERKAEMSRRFDEALDQAIATGFPAIVIGHGLGSVVAVERLRERPIGSRTLVTLGSPVALLAELNWIEGGAWGSSSLWINAYDFCDPLSFPAGPAFGEDQGIRDIALDSGLNPFAAHGAYWDNSDLWRAIIGS